MTKQAFIYAAARAVMPPGRWLWLYGDPSYATGELYSPRADVHAECERRTLLCHSEVTQIGDAYDAVILQAPKQVEEAEGLLALAMQRSRGRVMALARNDAGGKRLARYFGAYGVEAHALAKDHCQIVWTDNAPMVDKKHVASGLAQLELRQREMDGRNWWTVPGLFGWNQVDEGSRLLAQFLPGGLVGAAADLGCGWGYLSAHLAACSWITSIDAYEVDARACAAAKKNLPGKVQVHWQDICQLSASGRWDVVVMNPPFHTGKQEDIALGEQFVRKAWESLRAGGRLYMVANRTLPYEHVLPQWRLLGENARYKCIEGIK